MDEASARHFVFLINIMICSEYILNCVEPLALEKITHTVVVRGVTFKYLLYQRNKPVSI